MFIVNIEEIQLFYMQLPGGYFKQGDYISNYYKQEFNTEYFLKSQSGRSTGNLLTFILEVQKNYAGKLLWKRENK